MPELPEIETLRRGLAPALVGEHVETVTTREARLRWPVDPLLGERLRGRRIEALRRRAKYLLIDFADGHLLVHLGMSGSLRLVARDRGPGLHDHLDIVLGNGRVLRYHDPRRFGCILWTEGDPLHHRLLRGLGPEPLADGFDGTWLHRAGMRRRVAVKHLIMDARVVVGVGNIYASESLYMAGIAPWRRADRVAAPRYARLAQSIGQVLREAITAGGTTLRDFVNEAGEAGYFARLLRVYGQEGAPCPGCGAPIRRRMIGQRSSFYCASCQR